MRNVVGDLGKIGLAFPNLDIKLRILTPKPLGEHATPGGQIKIIRIRTRVEIRLMEIGLLDVDYFPRLHARIRLLAGDFILGVFEHSDHIRGLDQGAPVFFLDQASHVQCPIHCQQISRHKHQPPKIELLPEPLGE